MKLDIEKGNAEEDEQEVFYLGEQDLKNSIFECILHRCLYLYSILFGLALLLDHTYHLHILKQCVSLLLIALQVFVMNLNACSSQSSPPILSYFYQNFLFFSLFIFHIHMLFGFSWNPYVYVILAVIVLIYIFSETFQQSKAQFLIFGPIICLITLAALNIQGFFSLDWDYICILPTIFIAICECEIVQNLWKMLRNQHSLTFTQGLIHFAAFNFGSFPYFALISNLTISLPIGQTSLIIYLSLALIFFTLSTYFEDQFVILLCRPPRTVFRRSQTNFHKFPSQTKKRNTIQYDIQYCAICYRSQAQVLRDKCSHLALCQQCHDKTVQKDYHFCPICKQFSHFVRGTYVLKVKWRQEGYRMKFHIPSKIHHNQYLIIRERQI